MTDEGYFETLNSCPLKCVGCEYSTWEMNDLGVIDWRCVLDECILELEEHPVD